MGNKILDKTADALLIVGGLNWGLVGLFDANIVTTIFGGMPILETIVYSAVGLSAGYKFVMMFMD